MAPLQATLIGTVLDGKYGLEDLLGHGGMGAVYRANHLGTGRQVAVKLLLPEWTGDAEAVARFRREARASGGLRHPNVVDVTDFGVCRIAERNVAYLVMELLEGSTLRDLVKSCGPLPLEIVVELTEQIAAALEAAHQSGIVHRDLKPENIWLVSDARGGFAVRVLDFGIALIDPQFDDAADDLAETSMHSEIGLEGAAACAVVSDGSAHATVRVGKGLGIESDGRQAAHSEEPKRDTSSRLTSAGSVVGTPYYMSPEQCQGLSVGPTSDVYSFGVLIWEVLSGFKPFRGNREQVIQAHLETPPPAIDRVKPDVSASVLRALAKRPDERYQSARAFAGCLRAAAEGPWVILRRCAALYANRFPEMLAVSWNCSRPAVLIQIVLLIIALALWWAPGIDFGEWSTRVLMLAVIVAPLLWMIITLLANATFALVIERMRTRPLENLDPRDLAVELRRRLDLPDSTSYLRTVLRLALVYIGSEMRSKAGAGDLAFLIGLLERRDSELIPARCAVLTKGSRPVYRRVVAAIFAGMFVPVLFEAGLITLILASLGNQPSFFVYGVALALMPINAVLVTPITSSALTLLYFRARQAQGEDVALAAVLPGRL